MPILKKDHWNTLENIIKNEMKIQIDGTNIKNKGAELMLYCVLEQIEKSFPEAVVYWNDDSMMGSESSIKTSLNFKKSSWQKIAKALSPFKVQGILRRLGLPYRFLTRLHALQGLDLVLDASGFHYSDQFKIQPEYVKNKQKYFLELKNNGTKLIFLPQAFGPFKTKEGKALANLVVENGDLIFARDQVSFEYVSSISPKPSSNLLEYPDITVMSSYKVPEAYRHLTGAVCIIPNKRMVDKGELALSSYIEFLQQILKSLHENGEKVFLLNHEGAEDLELCKQLQKDCGFQIEVVSGLDAKEIKGLISISKFVISSRFHGVASALSTAVPCLATSWSHKYEELFNSFGLKERLLDVADIEGSNTRLKQALGQENYDNTKTTLNKASEGLKERNKTMWSLVWETAGFSRK